VAWLGVAAFVSVGVAGVVSVAGINLARSAAVRARYEKVEVGMTGEQVDVLLEGGRPLIPDFYEDGGGVCEHWDFSDYIITVVFAGGPGDVVSGKSIEPVPRSWLERLKALWPF
jgi:hypothetical protein